MLGIGDGMSEFESWVEKLNGNPLFPWQRRLFEVFMKGDLPSALDIPTGLGKTSVISIWLAARAMGAMVPTRLVYVVDRRAVVDQATDEAMRLRKVVDESPELRAKLGLRRSLPISTLRGQFADNRQWLEDPSEPAIVLGTVDMVGSRLLFQGYGVSPKMRPYHAALLGVDSLIALDEAHLVPPFQKLLTSIQEGQATARLGSKSDLLRAHITGLRLLSLSATGRGRRDGAFTLDADDRKHEGVAKRLHASKVLTLRDDAADNELAERLATEAWTLADEGRATTRCIVFCNKRDDAQKIHEDLLKRGKRDKVDIGVELFVGGRRVFERAEAATRLRELGFIAGSTGARTKAAFVIATSAGEVGVDLDADHMVSDLVAWERMVQRLGRVNRRGEGAAKVVVVPVAPEDKDHNSLRRAAVRRLIAELPAADDGVDTSPQALTDLKRRCEADESLRAMFAEAETPAPLHPPLERAHVEAWSMTSLEDHTGRPEVQPWLRGWIDDQEPETTLVWRGVLPVNASSEKLLDATAVEAYRNAADPHMLEGLNVEVYRALKWLKERETRLSKARHAPADLDGDDASSAREAHDEAAQAAKTTADLEADGGMESARATRFVPIAKHHIALVVLDDDGESVIAYQLQDLTGENPRVARNLERSIVGKKVLIDSRLGGLTEGLLDATSDDARDLTRELDSDGRGPLPFRIRREKRDARQEETEPRAHSGRPFRQEVRVAIDVEADGDEKEWLVIESDPDVIAQSEEGRSLSPKFAQTLIDHQQWAMAAAKELSERLRLPKELGGMLALAAVLHDEGKRATCWQTAFHAPRGGETLAKTTSRPNFTILGGYRHELGSLPVAEGDPRVRELPARLRELCLHVIAAHHGQARPLLRTTGAEEPPSVLESRAQAIALRFCELTNEWGPWGLAWWETLLRAADVQASKRNDQREESDRG